jgi:hypothetical protein
MRWDLKKEDRMRQAQACQLTLTMVKEERHRVWQPEAEAWWRRRRGPPRLIRGGELEGPGVWQTLGKKKGGRKKTGVWQTLEKKKYIHTHSYTHMVVHTSMYDGEED